MRRNHDAALCMPLEATSCDCTMCHLTSALHHTPTGRVKKILHTMFIGLCYTGVLRPDNNDNESPTIKQSLVSSFKNDRRKTYFEITCPSKYTVIFTFTRHGNHVNNYQRVDVVFNLYADIYAVCIYLFYI